SNRDAIGARVLARLADGTRRTLMVKTGSSYLSQSELPLTIGLGGSGSVEAIEVTWPTGSTEKLAGAPPGQTLVIEEGRGIVARVPFAAQSLRPATGPR